MAVFLFDEDFWLSQDSEVYLTFLKSAGITDIMVLPFGGSRFSGYTSAVETVTVGTETSLADFASLAASKNIRTHAVFNVCQVVDNTNTASYGNVTTSPDVPSGFVDITDATWQTYIKALIVEAAAIPNLSGIGLDHIRTDQTPTSVPSATYASNMSTIAGIVSDIYDEVKSINPDLILSCFTGGWQDHFTTDGTDSGNHTGRLPLNWSKYMDIVFRMDYGGYNAQFMPASKSGSVTGDKPWLPLYYNTQDFLPATCKAVLMVSCYITGPDTSGVVKWQAILDELEHLDDFGIYTGAFFSAAQGAITAGVRANTLTRNKELPTNRTGRSALDANRRPAATV